MEFSSWSMEMGYKILYDGDVALSKGTYSMLGK